MNNCCMNLMYVLASTRIIYNIVLCKCEVKFAGSHVLQKLINYLNLFYFNLVSKLIVVSHKNVN
jgi:hypothetical protein